MRRSNLAVRLLLALPLVGLGCEELMPDGPGSGPDGGPDGSPESVTEHAPALETALATFSGPLGADLRIDVHGSDVDGDAAGLAVRILDAAGSEVSLFDSDADGFPDSGAGYLPFGAPLEAPTEPFDAFATLPAEQTLGLELASLEVALVDSTGLASAILAAEIAAQPVRGDGEGCDPTFVRDRCADGLGCKGTPPTCQPGEPPAITRLAYLAPTDGAIAGPRLLIEGSEPDNDLATLHLELLDQSGTPVSLDFDGDGATDASTFDVDASTASNGGAFFVALDLGLGVQELVTRIAVTPSDRGGRVGERIEADYAPAELRNLGQACSPNGFDTCVAGAVCSLGPTGSATCQGEASARNQQCNAAPTLTLTDGHASYVGVADGTSLWDAPSGCSVNDPTGRAESVVVLRLDQEASRLTITTDTMNTNFDTTLYLVSPCATAGSAAVACNDDGAETVAASLELTSVPAGSYAIIVDSFSTGGTFGLDVTVE